MSISILANNEVLYFSSGYADREKRLAASENTLYELASVSNVDSELSFYPGKQYTYGTVNYDVLGLVIEMVSGQSYEDFMREQVFQPLGLHQAYPILHSQPTAECAPHPG